MEGEPPKDSSTELIKRLSVIREAYTSAWRSDAERPRIEDYIVANPEIPAEQLTQTLVELEVSIRSRNTESVTSEEYLHRFPALDRDWIVNLITNVSDETSDWSDDSVVDTRMPTKSILTNGEDMEHVRINDPSQDCVMSSSKIGSFGDYEIICEIARGGMGVVYKAHQKSLNRIVALKMILAGQLAGDNEIRRFRTEAEAAANLDHPGIVPLYEIGEYGGQQYFSMGFVPGDSLASKVGDGRWSPSKAADMTRRIAEAIAYAHDRGVIHRDLKPGNILVDMNGEPRITDFGLSKRIGSDSNLTGTGQILGTPNYMPPEQALGDASKVDERADIWALGAILYALLTGRPPFQAASTLDTLKQVIDNDPMRPRSIDPKIPVDLETIVLKCLEKDVDRRYATTKQLVDELIRFGKGEPVVARPIGRATRIWRWCKRKPAVAALVFLSAVAILFAAQIRFKILANRDLKLRDEVAREQLLELGSLKISDESLLHLRPLPTRQPELGDFGWRIHVPSNTSLRFCWYLGEWPAPFDLPTNEWLINARERLFMTIASANQSREVVCLCQFSDHNNDGISVQFNVYESEEKGGNGTGLTFQSKDFRAYTPRDFMHPRFFGDLKNDPIFAFHDGREFLNRGWIKFAHPKNETIVFDSHNSTSTKNNICWLTAGFECSIETLETDRFGNPQNSLTDWLRSNTSPVNGYGVWLESVAEAPELPRNFP